MKTLKQIDNVALRLAVAYGHHMQWYWDALQNEKASGEKGWWTRDMARHLGQIDCIEFALKGLPFESHFYQQFISYL
jgi:hypothetical protein